MRGRKKTTGKFRTRRILEDRVVFLRERAGLKTERIAEHCQISAVTVNVILADHRNRETISAKVKSGAASHLTAGAMRTGYVLTEIDEYFLVPEAVGMAIDIERGRMPAYMEG